MQLNLAGVMACFVMQRLAAGFDWSLMCRRGAIFDRGKHLQGTEVKAITYSAMQILEREGDAEVFVIVDI